MLEIKNISAGYNRIDVIKEISFSVEENSLISIIGPNGSGKSTLLKAIAGIIELSDGSIYVNEANTSKLSSILRAKEISYLPQGRNIPDMTVEQLVLHGRFPYLSYPRKYSETDKNLAKEAMKKTDILNMKNKRLSELSGGQRQKAYIAMALTQNTDYILLDEPTTYLDISQQLSVMKYIKTLSENGKGIIAVMHDLPFAFTFSDKILVLDKGKIIGFDCPDKILQSGILPTVFGVRLQKNSDGTYSYTYN